MEQEYRLENMNEVERYINTIEFIEAPSYIEEIGNGNMNYVYRIKEAGTGKTFILKHAAEHTRISEDIRVSTDRIRIEADVLQKLERYVLDYIPHIYQYDDLNKCIIMEECKGYSILRDLLNRFETVEDFADKITSYLVRSIIPTRITEDGSKSEEQFVNPLCDITKAFVFTEPFDRYSSTNSIYEPNRRFISEEVFGDRLLLDQIVLWKKQFTENKQALIHGDLHTGSIFANKASIKVFDYEFAFYGPIGFDIGNLVANLIFSWLHAKAQHTDKNDEFIIWLEATIVDTIDILKEKFNKELPSITDRNDRGTSLSINQMIHDTAAFAGVELLRRIIGIAHVSDITSIACEEDRVQAERAVIRLAKEFILSNDRFHSGENFIDALTRNYGI